MQYPIQMGQTPSGIVTMPMTGQAQSGMMKMPANLQLHQVNIKLDFD